jgi:DNA-binding transcriptional MerR regulator
MPPDDAFTIADLARLTGLNVRTIRYYLAQGLIPASGESGPGAHYGRGHLDRLRLVKRLQAQHLPLAEIRDRLAALSDEEVAGLVATGEEPAAPDTTALEYVRTLLRAASPPAPADGGQFSEPPAMGTPVAASSLPARQRRAGARRAPPAAMVARRGQEPVAPYDHELVAGATSVRPPLMPAVRDRPAATEVPPSARSQWERLSLGPNIELHVRRPLGRLEQRRVERLITIARQVLKEDGV